MADGVAIGRFMTLLSDNFGGEMSKDMTEFVTEMLSKFSNEQLDQGLKRLLFTRKYSGFPKIAEMLEAIQGEVQAPQEALRLEAETEFEKVWGLPNDVQGNPRPAELAKLSPAARHVLRMMGGTTRHWLEKNQPFISRDFVDRYMRLASNPQKMQELGYEAKPYLAMIAGGKQ